jgi:hypothetical protein
MQSQRKPEKPAAKPEEQASPHPEKLKSRPDTPSRESSKATPRDAGSKAPQPDARTGHDKDGNEGRAASGKRP